ncbi:MAG: hypothetical protein JJT76_16040 [Clostridiaceae bacterium]|nr:hypothetical protein [Clostridiaceae bacterium]
MYFNSPEIGIGHIRNRREFTKDEQPLVSENAMKISGIINLPEGEKQEELWDEFIDWLEGKGGGFFGMTAPIAGEEEADSAVERVLEDIGLDYKQK